MRFDYYAATIDARPHDAISTLAKLGHEVRNADGIARKYHYSQGFEIHHNQRGVVARVLAGGNGDKPFAFASSDDTDAFVDLVRNEYPDRHLVTRMDAAQDFKDAKAYDRIRPVLRKIAKRHRLSFPKYEDDLSKTAGRTQYVGSPQSDYRARLYEKGWEQVGKLLQTRTLSRFDIPAESITCVQNCATGERMHPDEWKRLELQVRPRHEEGRRIAATVTPEEAWSFSPWCLEVAKEVLALDLEKIVIRTKKISKDEEALRWMCQQYGAMLSRLHGDLGDWACVGLQIGDIIKEQAKA